MTHTDNFRSRAEPGRSGKRTVFIITSKTIQLITCGFRWQQSGDYWSTPEQDTSYRGIQRVVKFQTNPQNFYLLMWPGKSSTFTILIGKHPNYSSTWFYCMKANLTAFDLELQGDSRSSEVSEKSQEANLTAFDLTHKHESFNTLISFFHWIISVERQ